MAAIPQKAANRTFAVLTSGGDSPGMNAALRSIVRLTLNFGGRILIIRDGYEGLVQGRISLGTWGSVAGILNRGGTILGSSRSESFRTVEGRRVAARRLLEWNVDTLFVIGGDGSLTGATLLSNEWAGHHEALVQAGELKPSSSSQRAGHLHVVGLVGSIDNDLSGSDLTIGCDTALHRICEAIDTITSTADSHQRHFIIEVMGRNCGWLALMAALATGSDWVFIPERPAQAGWAVDIVRHLTSGTRRFSMVIVAEGAQDESGQRISCEDVHRALAAGGLDSRITVLGHVQRGGAPSAIDRVLSSVLGAKAVESAVAVHFSGGGARPAPVVLGVKGLSVVELPLVETIANTQAIPRLLAAKDWRAVCAARSAGFENFFEMLKVFTLPGPIAVPDEDLEEERRQQDAATPSTTTTTTSSTCSPSSATGRRINIGLLHCGAVAPGMNAVVRSLVRLGANKGHRIFGVTSGFKGLINGQVKRLRWLDVRQWVTEPGARLKTRRDGNFSISDCMKICQVVESRQLDVLVMIGGWDGYLALHDLHTKAKDYPALSRLHMYCVPASISNGLPCTAQSVGADTALNVMTTAISFIKSSAAASRRVYVVEVMGRGCGFLALTSSLACGAEEVILPEIPISLNTLSDLSENLKVTFRDFHHDMAIVITSERPDPHKVLSPQFIADVLLREADGLYGSVRFSKLGHVQQGAPPSPHDRILALSYGSAVLQHIEQTFQSGAPARPARVCVGVRETGETIFTSLDDMIHEMDLVHRRPTHQWWFERLYPYALTLAQPGPLAELRKKHAAL